MWNPLRRKERQTKSLQQPVSRSGWTPVMSYVHEPYAGAWQQNMEIRPKTVLSYYAVFSCISLIASDIAKMPLRLMRQDSSGVRKEVKTGKIAALYSRPNAFQNRIQFF